MTVTGTARGSRPLPAWTAPLLAAALAVGGLVGLTLLFAGTGTYEAIARADAFDRIPFLVPANVAVERRQQARYDVATRTDLHAETLGYVLGGAPGTPRDPTTREPLFTPDEQRHLADVRGVFDAARGAATLAAIVAGVVLVIAAIRGGAVLARAIRGAAVLAAIAVAAVGLVAAVAFEPAFLAFHEVFFPQGNFLFDPATSNLLALYPEAYWYGVTVRIGVAFVAVAAAIAALATMTGRARAAR